MNRGVDLVLSNELGDADSRDREQVGDEATRGKRTKGTPDKHMTKEEVTMFLRNARH